MKYCSGSSLCSHILSPEGKDAYSIVMYDMVFLNGSVSTELCLAIHALGYVSFWVPHSIRNATVGFKESTKVNNLIQKVWV